MYLHGWIAFSSQSGCLQEEDVEIAFLNSMGYLTFEDKHAAADLSLSFSHPHIRGRVLLTINALRNKLIISGCNIFSEWI